MSATPAKSNHIGCIITSAAIIVLFCCGTSVVALAAYLVLGKQVPLPALQSSNSPIPTQAAPVSNLETFTGKGAPFTIQYPSDWTVEDQESDSSVVVFISPDQNASASVTYGSAAALTASQAADRVVSSILVDAQVIGKKTNSDGSVTVEVEHTNEDLGGRVHGYLRVIIAGGQFYVVQFNALVDNFDTYKQNGSAIVNSLKVGK